MTDKFDECQDCRHRRKPVEKRIVICNRCESGEMFEDDSRSMNPERDFRFESIPVEWRDDFEE